MSPQPSAEQEAGAAAAQASAALPAAAPARGSAPPGARNAWTALALVIATLAAALAGVSWWQSRERLAALESSVREASASIESALDGIRSHGADLADRAEALERELDADRERVRGMADRLDPMPERLTALERRVEADSGSSDARSEWLRAEAEYYLAVANTELALGGRWETAISALELADDRLHALGDPSFTQVRRLVADELLELKSVRLPDIEGVAFGLSRLAGRVDELPLRQPGPAGRPAAAPLADVQPGLDRLWLTVKRALGSIVSVERSEEPVARALSADEGSLARRRLTMELELARAAALNGESQAFAASLRQALALLEADFDVDSAPVTGAGELLRQLLDMDIAPERPDISASLKMLRRVGRQG